jgi:hypothetical protein
MVQKSLVTFLAAFGGILIILGGILGFLLSFGPERFGGMYNGAAGALLLGLVAVIFGLVILAYSGYTHIRGADHSLSGGIVLLVLGIVTWIVVGGWLLVAVGSFLAVLAGLILIAQILFSDPRFQLTTTS